MTTPPRTTGTVHSVNVSTEKGTIKTPVDQIMLNERGIVDDAHAGGWHRQVSLLEQESIARFAAEAGRNLECGEFAENITTRGLDLSRVAVLDRFTIGPVELEVTQLGKKCHGAGCAIYNEVGQCIMPKEGIFCRVVQGGTIKPEDVMIHVPRLLQVRIITMSDRASQGVYEDRSGPKVKEYLDAFFQNTRWHAHIIVDLLPDDADTLTRELAMASTSGIDIVFTTGGTGVGPRDITPDVVTDMADKLIPGIMEHIRIKYGAQKPNALLSRSVAAVIGNTLVYTLPGSVRAVDEYMSEILQTIEHTLLMLHGLGHG